jgi:SAM-dependent methyltransferase
MDEEQTKAVASQLGCPTGEDGIRTADMMHVSNLGMITSTADALNLADNELILELGHGSGKHINQVLACAAYIRYYGLEISPLMSAEARKNNPTDNASFHLYDGEKIPFEKDFFHKAMTVNTIYFWKNPIYLLNSIYSILKTGGLFCIGFSQKEFMEGLPFTQHGFNLYDNNKLKNLIHQTPFKLIKLEDFTENVNTMANEVVERPYTVVTLQK